MEKAEYARFADTNGVTKKAGIIMKKSVKRAITIITIIVLLLNIVSISCGSYRTSAASGYGRKVPIKDLKCTLENMKGPWICKMDSAAVPNSQPFLLYLRGDGTLEMVEWYSQKPEVTQGTWSIYNSKLYISVGLAWNYSMNYWFHDEYNTTLWMILQETGRDYNFAAITDQGYRDLKKYNKSDWKGFDHSTCTPSSGVSGKVIIRNTIANSAKRINDVIWDKSAVRGATHYQINWRARGANKWASRTVGNTSRGTTSGLTIGGLYEIRVRPVKAATKTKKAGYGAWSPTVYRYFHTTQKIRLASKSAGSFTMSWAKNPQATSYQVMYTTNKNGAGAANNIYTVGANATSFTKAGLRRGVTYYVQVREIRKVGNINYIGNISCPVAVKIK